MEFRLNTLYREDNDVPWLFLFVVNVWTVTKRQGAGFKKIAVNSNSNYVVIINYYVMIILIILRIPSILLFIL